jgi:hypothetical protein
MRRYLLDKILDGQDKYDELVQREGRHTTRRFALLGSAFIVQIIKPCLLGVYVVKQIVRFAVAAEVRSTHQCPARAKAGP